MFAVERLVLSFVIHLDVSILETTIFVTIQKKLKMLFLEFQNSQNVNPKESFAWKDKTLDTELKALRDARYFLVILIQ